MLMERRLEKVFQVFVRRGTLEVVLSNGRRLKAGDGSAPHVVARFADAKAQWEIMADPELKLGELYMDGRLVLDEGSIYDLLRLLLQDSAGDRSLTGRTLIHMRNALRKVTSRSTFGLARKTVAHHYDLNGRLYDLFLDADRQYSCAYFERPDLTLEEAQLAKKRHVAAKLLVDPGHSVLDIGSGWGGLPIYLAETAGAGAVRGITLSEEHLAIARERAAQRGLSDRVTFELQDYRETRGRFDRIVSVGMFEHVGANHYDDFFRAAASLLADDGVMLLHTVGRTGEPGYTNPWITKYIFPGSHLPTLSEVMAAIERAGLMLNDAEVLRLHYAETLRHWRERFIARRAEAEALYDARFHRMWECYLAMSEAAFRFEDVVVFQLQLTRRNDVVPLTRDYIGEREAALRRAERSGKPVAPRPPQFAAE